MRKVIMGSIMFLTGVLSAAVLVAGAIVPNVSVAGEAATTLAWRLNYFGLTPVLWILGGVMLVGLLLAIWGAAERK